MTEPAFPMEEAHRFFSKQCFNQAWDLIDKPDRTPEDNERMIQLAQASLWHWSERPDCTDKNLSIGYWQLSRIYSLVGDGAAASKYAQLCLDKTPTDDSFLMGYAYEALARAEGIRGNAAEAKTYYAKACELAVTIVDADSQQMLSKDLEGLC